MLLLAAAWLPLLVISLAEGRVLGSPPVIPLLGDFLAFGRYFVALPLLVLLHPVVDRRVAIALETLQRSGLVPAAENASLQRDLGVATAMWRSRLARVLLLATSLLAAFATAPAESLVRVTSWMFEAPGDAVPTAAGLWQLYAAAPLVRFLLLLALWRLLIWSWVLWRLARMPLRYELLHPDRCGGIGFLERVQTAFGILVAALSVQLGCLVADAVQYQGADLAGYRMPIAAFAVLMLVLLFAPMLAFARPLTLARERAETRFHAWVGHAARKVASGMLDVGAEDVAAQLASPEISSMTDSAALFEGATRSRSVPVSKRAVVTVLAAALLPIALPLLPLLPLKELAIRLAGLIL